MVPKNIEIGRRLSGVRPVDILWGRMRSNDTPPHAFRPVPRTGVIYVTEEARKRGYSPEKTDWCNLGQGQPESGSLPGAPPRIDSIQVDPRDHEYGPIAGLREVREAIAALYNEQYRQGKKSLYTAENVSICGGGRLALTRVVASLGQINLGHFLPDYTAYEELLDIFRNFTSIPILLEPGRGYQFSAEELGHEISGRGLGAILLSNPCNPTGKLVHGDELARWVETSREQDCTLILDEFYSRYVWLDQKNPMPVSAAAYVEDVDRDPVVLLDGFTKNFRYPGWRLGWVVAPRSIIEKINSAGSFLDGGGSRPLQRAALPLLEPGHVARETRAIFDAFHPKRRVLMEGLKALGITTSNEPQGTFYVWGDLAGLPGSLSNGMDLFQKGLDRKMIVVPGEFFDVNPGRRRPGHVSRFRSHARFSFGPPLATIEEGLKRLGALIEGER